jgi:hypothetical protein
LPSPEIQSIDIESAAGRKSGGVDGGMNRQHALSRSRRLEALRLAFPTPRRLVRIIGSVVSAQTWLRASRQSHF